MYVSRKKIPPLPKQQMTIRCLISTFTPSVGIMPGLQRFLKQLKSWSHIDLLSGRLLPVRAGSVKPVLPTRAGPAHPPWRYHVPYNRWFFDAVRIPSARAHIFWANQLLQGQQPTLGSPVLGNALQGGRHHDRKDNLLWVLINDDAESHEGTWNVPILPNFYWAGRNYWR